MLQATPLWQLSATNEEGLVFAHLAAENNHPECLQKLYDLGAGASLTAADNDGFTPAHFAAKGNHPECL